ncbi:class I adenylate-forming enzyme family protein [Nocardia sp. NPDC005366]|uniref:class I adenylate-forming enzyme family protein n=1 Tax=Nocardia sp. NPDC005366 TaxID=3156878 RepID=UPI0033B001AE
MLSPPADSSEYFGTPAMLSEGSVGAELGRAAAETPAGVALRWLTPHGSAAMSWIQLYRRAIGAARLLRALDPGLGRVALIADNSVDWVVAMFGCALAGRTAVPIGTGSTDAEVKHMLTVARATTVLVSERRGGDAVLARISVVAQQLPQSPRVRELREVTSAEGEGGESDRIDAGEEFLLQFTSGTTGVQKAAVLSHRTALNCARYYVEALGAGPGETWLNPLPLYHVGGSVAGVLVALAHRGSFTVLERFSPQVALRVLREIRPALVGLVPTMIIDLLGSPGVSAADFDSVRLVIGGATAVDPGLIADMETRLGITFLVAYGQSEAPTMTVSRPDDTISVRTRTLGRCLPGRDYRIVDEKGVTVPLGRVGELHVRGPLTMTGYLRPDGTLDSALDAEGWRNTGDLCSMSAEGILTFHSRLREMIIRGGLNVFPAEVEAVIAAHETVAEVSVFGVPDSRLGERVVAAVLPAAGAEIEWDEVLGLTRARLSRYKQPSEWIVATSVPRTSTGKIRKHQLRSRYEDGSLGERYDGG